MMSHVPYKLKKIFKDTMWGIAGLILMIVAVKYVVYAYWNYNLGREFYGIIINL